VALSLLFAACAYKPTIPPSQGHLSRESVAPPGEADKILPPVTNATYVPPPKPRAKTPTYSVVVNDVPVKELLMALARDTKENIDIHPGLHGLVSLNAIDETLPSILDRIAKQVNMRYRVEGKTIVVSPDTPYFKTYKVDYVNMTRDTTSAIAVSGQISTGGGGGAGGGVSVASGGASSTAVNSVSKNNFWEVLTENLQSLLKSTRALAQTAEDRQAQAEAARAAREERLAQAEAVARAGQNATNLFEKVFGSSPTAVTDIKQDIVVNQVAGTVSVMATERQHQLVQEYLHAIGSSSQRQVLIEVTVAEVGLSDQYQAGVDWSKVAIGAGFSATQILSAAPILPSGAPVGALTLSYLSNTNGNGAQFTIKMLEQFGKTRVLSSPMLMALNNQTALLKVVDNVVYFQIQSQISQGTTTAGNLQSVQSTPQTVAVGFIMSMTPQVNGDGVVSLTVRPTLTRVQKFVQDPNPALTTDSQGRPLPNPIPNLVPQVTVREMESVLQLISGQTAVLGGLMTDDTARATAQVPGLGNIPRVGELFQYRDDKVVKSELVIFIRPTVVKNPSLDSEELKHLRKFLPAVDQTGQNP
jgi:general secretion pathway protein D